MRLSAVETRSSLIADLPGTRKVPGGGGGGGGGRLLLVLNTR